MFILFNITFSLPLDNICLLSLMGPFNILLSVIDNSVNVYLKFLIRFIKDLYSIGVHL